MARFQPAAIELLERDHRKVVKLFERFETAKSLDDKLQIAIDICLELTVHGEMEERAFYPAAREVLDDDAFVDDAEADHQDMTRLIASLDGLTAQDERFQSGMLLLKQRVEAHIQEEELVLFPHLFESHLDFSRLAHDLEEAKEQVKHSIMPTTRHPSVVSVPRFVVGAQVPPDDAQVPGNR